MNENLYLTPKEINLKLSQEKFFSIYGRNKRLATYTLGCKVNQYETEAMVEQFMEKGYELVEFEAYADVYVINTCTVTNIADKKSRKLLSRAKKTNPNSLVVAVGCYVQVAHETLSKMSYIDILIGNTKKNEIVQIVENYTQKQTSEFQVDDLHHKPEYEPLHINTQQQKTRTTIKIQDGCDMYCSYCIIPYTRGAVRSRPMDDIIEEAKALVASGHMEFVLTGIHIASYGKDFDSKVRLIDLLEKMQGIAGIERIRLGSLEPHIITDEFLTRLKKCLSVCPHFHLSLQSGSNAVLTRMRRKYTTKEFMESVRKIRRVYPDVALTTDIIVGFPQETEEEAQETEKYVKKICFNDIHVFRYSVRQGTLASKMSPQIDEETKRLRSRSLMDIASSIKQQHLETMIGKIETVLFEDMTDIHHEGLFAGYTKNYYRIYVDSIENIAGKMMEVKVKSCFGDGLLGEIEKK